MSELIAKKATTQIIRETSGSEYRYCYII